MQSGSLSVGYSPSSSAFSRLLASAVEYDEADNRKDSTSIHHLKILCTYP